MTLIHYFGLRYDYNNNNLQNDWYWKKEKDSLLLITTLRILNRFDIDIKTISPLRVEILIVDVIIRCTRVMMLNFVQKK